MKKFNFFPYLFVFLATFLVLQLIQNGSGGDPILDAGEVGLKTLKNDYAVGKDIRVAIQNNGAEPLEIVATCTSAEGSDFLLPPFTIYRYSSEGFTVVTQAELKAHPACSEGKSVVLEPGEKKTISLLPFSYSYFGEPGRYKLALEVSLPEIFESPEFEIVEAGTVTKLWRVLIYQPILNVLVGLLIYTPGHHLGLAVIVLTLIIRTILLIPSQKAIQAQARMQEVQPKLEELKKKYGNDQARLAQETMLLWKTHKVNPLSSCLPLLVQMPILIALFYVVSGGLSPDRSALIYSFLPDFSLQEINPQFLSFNLLKKDIIVFPLVIGGLQFLQMHLMSSKRKKGVIKSSHMPQEVETANKMMKYVMPIMIAIFTAQLPAAVGLYWGTSTFYGIVQQVMVNKKGSNASSSEDDVQIRVLPHRHGKEN